MLKITVACVGRLKEKYLTDAVREYEKRLSRYCRLQWIEVQDERTLQDASPAENSRILRAEGERLRKAIPTGSFLIALDLRGEMLSSEEFAGRIERLCAEGTSHIVFIIGGSTGLDPEILKCAGLRVSFSRMTFPHQLMRVVLAEQVYRAFRIIHGEPYHK